MALFITIAWYFTLFTSVQNQNGDSRTKQNKESSDFIGFFSQQFLEECSDNSIFLPVFEISRELARFPSIENPVLPGFSRHVYEAYQETFEPWPYIQFCWEVGHNLLCRYKNDIDRTCKLNPNPAQDYFFYLLKPIQFEVEKNQVYLLCIELGFPWWQSQHSIRPRRFGVQVSCSLKYPCMMMSCDIFFFQLPAWI